jgi:membrane fusion protein, multidrug efflux system
MSRRHRTLLRLVLLVMVPAVAISGFVLWWLAGGRYVATENAYVKADIAQIAPEIAGRVLEVRVRDHAQVKAGDVLLRLDPEPFQLALDRAEAELDAARTQVETMRATWREVSSELAEAEARSQHFTRQWQRQEELALRGFVSASRREEAENEARAATDRAAIVREKLQRVLTALSGTPTLPTEDHPMVRERRAARNRAAYDLSRAVIEAPLDGVVVNVRVQPGEQVKAATALFALVAASRPWVEANFKETELTHVKVGQKATVVLDIYPDVTWEAEVQSLSPATGAEFAILPPQNASGNWVKVVQRLPVRLHLLPHGGEPPLRAGMTASVRVDTGRERKVGEEMRELISGKKTPGGAQARTN